MAGSVLFNVRARLLGLRIDTVCASLLYDFRLVKVREFVGSLDIADLLVVALGEDNVDLLQAAACRLGVCEVDDREEDGVENGEEEVGTPTARACVIDQHGCDHDNEEVPKPVADSRTGSSLGTSLQRVNLSRVQPGEG